MNNISPDVWGPSLWHFIHVFTFSYPERPSMDEQMNARRFFETLATILPCENCREHTKLYLRQHPPQVLSRDALIQYAYNFHLAVNKRINSSPPPDYTWFRNSYLDGTRVKVYDNSTSTTAWLIVGVVATAVIGGSGYIYYKNKTKKS
jgi:hypothetical protein